MTHLRVDLWPQGAVEIKFRVIYGEKFNLVLVAVCCWDSMEIITERSQLIMKYSADWVNALNSRLRQRSISLFITVWQSSWCTHQYECSHPCRVCWWWGWGWGQCCGSCNKLNRWSIHRTEWWLKGKNTTWSTTFVVSDASSWVVYIRYFSFCDSNNKCTFRQHRALRQFAAGLCVCVCVYGSRLAFALSLCLSVKPSDTNQRELLHVVILQR